jgi:hypothetical protein
MAVVGLVSAIQRSRYATCGLGITRSRANSTTAKLLSSAGSSPYITQNSTTSSNTFVTFLPCFTFSRLRISVELEQEKPIDSKKKPNTFVTRVRTKLKVIPGVAEYREADVQFRGV